MKVGILTFHNAFNSGAMLQAYALQTVLRSWGIDAFFIEGGGHPTSRRFPPFKTLHQKLAYPLQFLNMLGIAQLKYARFIRFRNRVFHRRYMDLSSEVGVRDLDLLLVGSDQVWSPSCRADLLPYYLLQGVPDSVRKASYAASFGGDSVPTHLHELYRRNLKRFSAVSVREHSGVGIVRMLLGEVPCPVVLDPTLLLSAEDYHLIEAPRLLKEKYLCMYSPTDDRPLYAFASRIARRKGVRLVSVQSGRSGYWGMRLHDWRATSPDRFLSLIRHAECVITSSFHGTVFSLIYGVPFAIRLMNGSRANARFDTLLQMAGLKDHIVRDDISLAELDRILPFDHHVVEQRIAAARQASLEMLKAIVTGGGLS